VWLDNLNYETLYDIEVSGYGLFYGTVRSTKIIGYSSRFAGLDLYLVFPENLRCNAYTYGSKDVWGTVMLSGQNPKLVCSFGNLNGNANMNSASECIRKNINMSAKDSLSNPKLNQLKQ
jgi:hypothetical protein